LMDPACVECVLKVHHDVWKEVTSVIARVGDSQTRFMPGAAVAIISGCLTALDKLHSCGVVHGDIKPSNIMLTPSGEVRIIDIGSAFETKEAQKPYFCTPQYAAPEVLEHKACTPQSDLASLGYVLLEMMVGRPLFQSQCDWPEQSIALEATTGIPLEVDYELIEQKRKLPGRLEELLPHYGQTLRDFISKLIAPEPKDRFSSAQDAEVNPEIGRYVYHQQLVLCDLDAHFPHEFRVWLRALQQAMEADSKA